MEERYFVMHSVLPKRWKWYVGRTKTVLINNRRFVSANFVDALSSWKLLLFYCHSFEVVVMAEKAKGCCISTLFDLSFIDWLYLVYFNSKLVFGSIISEVVSFAIGNEFDFNELMFNIILTHNCVVCCCKKGLLGLFCRYTYLCVCFTCIYLAVCQ